VTLSERLLLDTYVFLWWRGAGAELLEEIDVAGGVGLAAGEGAEDPQAAGSMAAPSGRESPGAFLEDRVAGRALCSDLIPPTPNRAG
jgi:hypothetical protein